MIFIKVFELDFFHIFPFYIWTHFLTKLIGIKIMDAKIFLLCYEKNTTVDKQIVLFNT